MRYIVLGWPRHANEVLDLRPVNGSWHLWCGGGHNHYSDGHLQLFRQVAEAAPGSYGIMYIFDHDYLDEPWQRLIMRPGQVTNHDDSDLSPHIGAVEDSWTDPF